MLIIALKIITITIRNTNILALIFLKALVIINLSPIYSSGFWVINPYCAKTQTQLFLNFNTFEKPSQLLCC